MKGRVVALLAVALAALAALTPVTSAAFTGSVRNAANAAGSGPFTCAAAAQSVTPANAQFTYPLAETLIQGLGSAADISGNNRPGSYSLTGVTPGVAGPCPRDSSRAVALDGISGAIAGPAAATVAPNTFTLEIWFRSTSTRGGKLIGFGSSRTGVSNNYDRHLYLANNGQLFFGVNPGPVSTLNTTQSVADGAWHQAVATMSSTGMALYLDGAPVSQRSDTTTGQAITGYWRIGFDNLAGWPSVPTSQYLAASVAFASVYTIALTAPQVNAHYRAGLLNG